MTIYEEIPPDEIFPPAVDLDAAEIDGAAPLEDVAVDRDAGDHIIRPNARGAMLRAAPDVKRRARGKKRILRHLAGCGDHEHRQSERCARESVFH